MADRKAAAQKAAATRKRNREAQIARFGGNPAHTRKVKKAERILNDLLGGKLPSAGKTTSRRRVKPLPNYPHPTPIRTLPDLTFNPYGGIQIAYIRDLYGPRQLPAALSGYGLRSLNDAARRIGARPANNKRAAIARITRKARRG